MSQFTNGLDALAALNESTEGGSGNNAEFTPFKTGTMFKIKVIDKNAVQLAYSYGIYKKVNSFVAKNPAKRDQYGNAVDNYTPWDKAYKYYKSKSEVYTDEMGVKASQYRGKPRFAFAFYDLSEGKTIILDLTKTQAQGIAAVIAKYEKKLGKLAFELSKEGSGTSTKVTLSPVLDLEDDLTDKELSNFEKAPTEISVDVFNGIWFEQDESQMVELLTQSGFDVSLIGYGNVKEPKAEIPEEEDLPF